MNYNIEGLRLLDILYLGRHSTEVRGSCLRKFTIVMEYKNQCIIFPFFMLIYHFSKGMPWSISKIEQGIYQGK